MLYKAVEHLRWLTILWGLKEIGSGFHAQYSRKPLYVRDHLPDDQDPAVVNDVFDTNSHELAARCNGLASLNWITKEAKETKISLETFLYKISGCCGYQAEDCCSMSRGLSATSFVADDPANVNFANHTH